MSAPSIKRRVAFIVTLLVGSVGLSACGYKAPLYIPTPEQQQKLQEREARIQARKAKAAADKKAQKAASDDPRASQNPPVPVSDSSDPAITQ